MIDRIDGAVVDRGKALKFQLSISIDVQVESYIEIADYQMKFEEGANFLRKYIKNIHVEVKQKRCCDKPALGFGRQNSDAAPSSQTAKSQARRSRPHVQYEDL